MTKQSPRILKQNLQAAQARLELLVGVLDENASERQWGIGEECSKAADSLRRLVRDNQVPADYKVAVIGRFKAGKSSFVNELLGRRLAGEDTSPETAAITTFRHGDRVTAKIRLVDKVTWERLRALYAENPADLDAQRMANWHRFKDKAGKLAENAEVFDLEELERSHVVDGGRVLTIVLKNAADAQEQKRHEAEFRRQLKQYTSGSRPHHCLVESIEIEAPAPILAEGVTLVDTPGLDDTERFRVQLTEQAVQGVDAVLFLTKSGASYGQSEKEFLLSLLRKGAVKQLVFVVTQVDQTYDQHVRQARDQDEEPEPLATRIAAERRRIRAEVEATFDELGGDLGSAAVQRYREQLNAVEIAFTSAANHRDFIRKDPVRFPLSASDPGGMDEVKRILFRILSTESRLASAHNGLKTGTGAILAEMLAVIEKRRAVVRSVKNREVAEEKLGTFRREFAEDGKHFVALIRSDCDVLRQTLVTRAAMDRTAAELVALQADVVLAAYETDDAERHWRTRRSGNWGYMSELQSRVANKVFPKVAEQLTARTELFGDFIDKFRIHLSTLSAQGSAMIERLGIGEDLRLDVAQSLEAFLDGTLEGLQEQVEGEEGQIIALLEDFVDEEVEAKISAARRKVSDIFGRGTTYNQSSEVRGFYREVRSILREALSQHVSLRLRAFSDQLLAEAEALPDRALSQVRAETERAAADIRAAAEASVAGQKEAFEQLVDGLSTQVKQGQAELETLLSAVSRRPVTGTEAVVPVEPIANEAGPPDTESLPSDQMRSIRARAVHCVGRMTLRNGTTGWPLARIFAPEYLSSSTEAWLVDPYLAAPHQRRNLKEFISAILTATRLKALHVITGPEAPSDGGQDFFAKLDTELYEQAGLRVTLQRDPEGHDRFVVLDNGTVFKLGRGLDIYKPATGLASVNPALRKVRDCEIDVFSATPAQTQAAE